MNGYKNTWRTLGAGGMVKTFPGREACETHAQKVANRTGRWCGIEEWSPDRPQDALNDGWALVAIVQPASTLPTTDNDKEEHMAGPAPAPLAQLRDKDQELWHLLMSTERHKNPGTDTMTQALAAALLGDADLAKAIVSKGFLPMTVSEWPDLR